MNNKNKGFTLIELLAVIVILAIIMIIATMQVNRQIKKSRKNANDINKKTIVKAVKTCLVENSEEECNTIEKLQKNGYLEEFEDPWNKENKSLDDSYAIVINKDNTDARVIYFGDGITEEVESPPNEYFSWCRGDDNKHLCTDGLTKEGKKWLQDHDDILVFPIGVKIIKNCETGKNNCESFSGVNIDAIIINNSVDVSANFSGTSEKHITINVIKIDGGKLSNSIFRYTDVKNLVIGNASNIQIGQHTFSNSNVDNFKIEKGSFSWYGFQLAKIGTLTIGEGVTDLGANTFEETKIDKIILKANDMLGQINQPFRNSNHPCTLVIEENVTSLKSNVFANTYTSYCNYVRFFNLVNVEVKGDKKRFSKRDLFDFGLRWDQIPEDIGNPKNDSSYRLKLSKAKDFEHCCGSQDSCYNRNSKRYPFPSWVDIVD